MCYSERRRKIIDTMLEMLREKNLETFEHCIRIEKYCVMIGEKLGLSDEELVELADFARLHDVGKLGICRKILDKPGALSDLEWKEMRRHPEIGYTITKNVSELSQIANYILLHHERWDGMGYPKGYKEIEIPLFCRILSVADAYDVMTFGRVYRAACSKEDAIDELKNNEGSQFDPHITAIFIQIIEHNSML